MKMFRISHNTHRRFTSLAAIGMLSGLSTAAMADVQIGEVANT